MESIHKLKAEKARVTMLAAQSEARRAKVGTEGRREGRRKGCINRREVSYTQELLDEGIYVLVRFGAHRHLLPLPFLILSSLSPPPTLRRPRTRPSARRSGGWRQLAWQRRRKRSKHVDREREAGREGGRGRVEGEAALVFRPIQSSRPTSGPTGIERIGREEGANCS